MVEIAQRQQSARVQKDFRGDIAKVVSKRLKFTKMLLLTRTLSTSKTYIFSEIFIAVLQPNLITFVSAS